MHNERLRAEVFTLDPLSTHHCGPASLYARCLCNATSGNPCIKTAAHMEVTPQPLDPAICSRPCDLKPGLKACAPHRPLSWLPVHMDLICSHSGSRWPDATPVPIHARNWRPTQETLPHNQSVHLAMTAACSPSAPRPWGLRPGVCRVPGRQGASNWEEEKGWGDDNWDEPGLAPWSVL